MPHSPDLFFEPTPPSGAPWVESELDIRRYLSTIAALEHAEGIYRDALKRAIEMLHEQHTTIASLREQLAALRDESRSRAAS